VLQLRFFLVDLLHRFSLPTTGSRFAAARAGGSCLGRAINACQWSAGSLGWLWYLQVKGSGTSGQSRVHHGGEKADKYANGDHLAAL
jgi:hypothetical protein